jgi:hypothetical protein
VCDLMCVKPNRVDKQGVDMYMSHVTMPYYSAYVTKMCSLGSLEEGAKFPVVKCYRLDGHLSTTNFTAASACVTLPSRVRGRIPAHRCLSVTLSLLRAICRHKSVLNFLL